MSLSTLIADFYHDHLLYCQDQEAKSTLRNVIVANLHAMTEQLKAKNAMTQEAMDIFFKEREALRDKADMVLTKAIERGDDSLADIALEFLDIVQAKNPFDELRRWR